ncbi:MAG: hypothetical protein M3340_16130 [Actinomycetota bacterium]|nr:hypothetical protein [Actinomycetota bacterium]
MLLYAGELIFELGSRQHVAAGQIEFQIHPAATLFAHVAGPASDLAHLVFHGSEVGVSVPAGASLAPPRSSTLPERQGKESWSEQRISLTDLAPGDLSKATRLVFHISPSVQLPRFRLGDPSGPDIDFALPGWDLRLVPVVREVDERAFAAVVEARSAEPLTLELVERLGYRLFVLLSFVSGREVGVGPVCGLDDDDQIAWARWAPPRLRTGKAPAGWCPAHVLPRALPAVADGFSSLASDPGLQAMIDRAVEMLLSADSPEIVDVQVITACAGLELLAWAALRRHGWLDADAFAKINTGSAVRLLCRWAGVDPDLPDALPALQTRRKQGGPADGGGPEMLFGVRNRVVHPPKKLDDPAWPNGDELIESWQLATWYLQLALLRLLGYNGYIWSRLRLGNSEMDVEPVPWAANDGGP